MTAGIVLRPATREDAKRLFDWRNDADAVAFSKTGRLVEWEEHLVWLERSLCDPDRKLYIALSDAAVSGALAVPVGQGRIDIDREYDCCDLSVSVAPEHRQKGYGTAIVRELLARAKEYGVDAIGATVHGKNAGSLRAFLGAGFLMDHDFLSLYWAGEEARS